MYSSTVKLFSVFFFDVKFSDKTPASKFSQGYKPLTSSGSVLMTIPRVEEVFCPERLSAIRDIKKLSNSVQSQMFSHILTSQSDVQ